VSSSSLEKEGKTKKKKKNRIKKKKQGGVRTRIAVLGLSQTGVKKDREDDQP